MLTVDNVQEEIFWEGCAKYSGSIPVSPHEVLTFNEGDIKSLEFNKSIILAHKAHYLNIDFKDGTVRMFVICGAKYNKGIIDQADKLGIKYILSGEQIKK